MTTRLFRVASFLVSQGDRDIGQYIGFNFSPAFAFVDRGNVIEVNLNPSSEGGVQFVPRRSTNTDTTLVSGADYYLSVLQYGVSVSLPNSPEDGEVFIIKLASSGGGSGTALTVLAGSGDTIEYNVGSPASFVFSTNGESIQVIFNADTNNWEIF